ncbi:MAG: Yip1 family protein [Porticoccaceae bacterium]|nr:DUF1282 family protein [Pseudomonadales bacterium]MCP5173159.1 DUF1282 family protein [Pseudomonadales bacterium]
MLGHAIGLLYDPQKTWDDIAKLGSKDARKSLLGFIFMGMLPAIAFYIGTTKVGWTIIGDEPVRITPESAIPLAVLFYFALMGAVVCVGGMLSWMSSTYQSDVKYYVGVAFMGYCCTPIFLAGIAAAYPIWWLDILLATLACGYAIRLVYIGLPKVVNIPEDQGFLFASAAFAVALVYVVVVLTATVILWEYIATPVFTN